MSGPLIRAPVPGYGYPRPYQGNDEDENPFHQRWRRQNLGLMEMASHPGPLAPVPQAAGPVPDRTGFPGPPDYPKAPGPPEYPDRPEFQPAPRPGLWKTLLGVGLGAAAEYGGRGGSRDVAYQMFEAPHQRALQSYQRDLGRHQEEVGIVRDVQAQQWRKYEDEVARLNQGYGFERDRAVFGANQTEDENRRLMELYGINMRSQGQAATLDQQAQQHQQTLDQRAQEHKETLAARLAEINARLASGQQITPGQKANLIGEYSRAQGAIRAHYAKLLSEDLLDEDKQELLQQQAAELDELKNLFRSSGLPIPEPGLPEDEKFQPELVPTDSRVPPPRWKLGPPRGPQWGRARGIGPPRGPQPGWSRPGLDVRQPGNGEIMPADLGRRYLESAGGNHQKAKQWAIEDGWRPQ